MCAAPIHHRPPRAGLDRIDCAGSALAILDVAIERPLRPQTIAVMLDGERRGVAVVVVSGTHLPDDALEVVECFTSPSAHDGSVRAMFLASVRPPPVLRIVPSDPAEFAEHAYDDIDRWLEMSDIAEHAGVELIEWFVVGDTITCPRDHLGEPPRW